MEENDAAEGVEVTHRIHGRGVVVEHLPHFGAEPDDIAVRFYEDSTERTLPVYTVELAQTVATASVEKGSYGFTATIDDGNCTVVVQPDGAGEGYSIELLRNGERKDSASLSWPDH